jgi:hypothetical protein
MRSCSNSGLGLRDGSRVRRVGARCTQTSHVRFMAKNMRSLGPLGQEIGEGGPSGCRPPKTGPRETLQAAVLLDHRRPPDQLPEYCRAERPQSGWTLKDEGGYGRLPADASSLAVAAHRPARALCRTRDTELPADASRLEAAATLAQTCDLRFRAAASSCKRDLAGLVIGPSNARRHRPRHPHSTMSTYERPLTERLPG